MTNWPNIQEYRNLDVKFIDDPKLNSAADSDLETVVKYECNNNKDNADDFINGEKLQNSELKTVRCVIRKDFEETFKKFDRENGVFSQEFMRPKPQETAAVERSCIDQVRLQNHLKWKKQKEEEYLQKREAERIAQQKKREEEIRLEKMKKQKEKEKEEKIREWQEQKAREKEEKKKEKMVMKMLEKELKVTPSVDKEKLIEEWVKLKDKQKQMESEKRAELLKKEEESRALRQSLAELSYRQWKERLKGRMMTLPKNGYQIFGPKPIPVVKEDWNHDFISGSPRNQNNFLRGTKSTTTTSLSFRPPVKELEDLSKDIFYLAGLKSRTPSFYHLKRTKSGVNLYENNEKPIKAQRAMPLKELQPGTINLKKKRSKTITGGGIEEQISRDLSKKSEMDFLAKFREKHPEIYASDFLCFQAQGDQNRCLGKKNSELFNSLIGNQLLPNKKKIDVYINTSPEAENATMRPQKKQTVKNSEMKSQKEVGRETIEKKVPNESVKSGCKQKCCAPNRTRSLSLQTFGVKAEKTVKVAEKKRAETETATNCRRSRSYDKSIKKITKKEQKTKNCFSSKSMVKVAGPAEEASRSLRPAKSRTCCNQKRRSRSRKPSTPEGASKSDKKLPEAKKKPKRKNSLSKSLSFSDSPYYVKNTTKNLSKGKPGRRKSVKDVETKSDEVGHCRKLSMTKI